MWRMTDWEERYRAGDTPWNKGRAAPPLLELLGKSPASIWGSGPVLVPGCGPGHDVRALARLGMPVIGLDLSPTALEQAREFPVAGSERYELGDFLDPAWREGREFSAVWEHTCYCAIDPARRPDYAAAAAGCLAPGGLLAGVFYLNPFEPGEDDTGPPWGATIMELEARFSADFERVDSWMPQAAFPGREGREWLALFQRR
jgi:SAM-dependent methyltransferase